MKREMRGEGGSRGKRSGEGRRSVIRARQSRLAWLFLAPSLAGVAVFSAVPFVDVIRRSLLDAMGKETVGLANYRSVCQNAAFRLAAVNTARFLAVCLPLLMLTSFGLALLVFRRDGRGNLYRTSLVLPMVIPVAAIVLVWKILLCRDGLLNQMLNSLSSLRNLLLSDLSSLNRLPLPGGLSLPGGTGAGWEMDWVNGGTAFSVLIVTYIWKNAGYDLLLWMAGLAAIPESLYDAARVDGAGAFARLRYITIPELSGTFGLVAVLSLVNSFRVYREAYLLAGSYPDRSIYMIPHLFSHWFLTLDVQNMCTASMLLMGVFLSAVAVAALIKRMLRGMNGRYER